MKNKPEAISIVDDDASVCRGLAALVRSLGYPARTFGSGQEFLDSDALAHTACLISDVRMPGMNGIELQARLAAEGHRIPIIFIAANPDPGVMRQALSAGAIAFHTKPFDEEHFISSIERALSDKAA